MKIETLCERLEKAARPETRQRLLAQLSDRPDGPAALIGRARRYLHTLPKQALRLAEYAVETADQRDDLRTQADALRALGQALRALGRHADALTVLETAGMRARQAGNLLLACRVQMGRIDSFGWLGRFEDGIAFAARMEAELGGLDAQPERASVLLNVGGLHARRDRYEEALECNRRALELLQHVGNPVAVADAQTNCAAMLLNLGRHEEALALFEAVRTVYVEQGLDSRSAKVDANIGQIHYVSGRYGPALAAQIRARQAFADLEQEIETAIADTDIADAYRALNLWPEALERYEQAMRILSRCEAEDDHARAEQGYAAALWNAGRREESLDALARAERIFVRQKNVVQRAHVRLQRGLALFSEGRWEESRAETEPAFRGLAKNRLPGRAAEARFLLAELDREAGQNTLRRLVALRRVAEQQGKGWLECRIARAIGLHYAATGKTTLALRHLRGAVLALEQIRTQLAPEELTVAFLRDKTGVYEDLIGLLLQRGRRRDIQEALETLERSRSRLLLERLLNALDRPAGDAGTRPEARENLARLRAELSRAYFKANALDSGEARRLSVGGALEAESLAPLEQAYREALREQELLSSTGERRMAAPSVPAAATGRLQSARVFALSAPIRQKALQEALLPDETLVQYYAVGGSVCAFVLSRSGTEALTGLASVREVEYLKRRLRYHLQKATLRGDYRQRHDAKMQAGITENLERLWRLLWKPLEEKLRGEKVMLIPFGMLHGLPFHAFYDGRGYVLDRWEIAYAPGAALWQAGVQRATDRSASHWEAAGALRTDQGDLTAGPAPSALVMGVPGPGVEGIADEIAAVAALLSNSRVFCGAGATLGAFQAHAGQSRWIHLAAHALFRDDNPLFSGLQFADGWLLARDLYDMKLDCELTTLAACRTGTTAVDAGDELFGLVRGFLAAGARSLAVSLWPIDDAATTALMPAFYAQLGQGRSKAAALRAAQCTLREQWPHPCHWASFALVGER